MPNNNSVINLGDLSKPATVLIEKISEATGGIFKPWQIRRVAKAKAEANKIKAISKIEITQLQQRALQRFIYEEAKKQNNIEEITRLALPQLRKDAKPEKMEDDWISNFFDKCRLISDQEMQSLWSKVLAGEANNPGSYSKRTINIMASLDKEDATLFTKLCNFGWVINEIQPLIFDINAKIYTNNGINFGILNHLNAIGLISFNHITGYLIKRLPKKILVAYQNTTLILEFEKIEDNEIIIGQVLLTGVGKQLARICTTENIIDFNTYVIRQWIDQGIIVSSPYNHPPLDLVFMKH